MRFLASIVALALLAAAAASTGQSSVQSATAGAGPTIVQPITPGNCAQWANKTQLKDSGGTCGGGSSSSASFWTFATNISATSSGVRANLVALYALPPLASQVPCSHLVVNVSTADTVTADLYSFGIYDVNGNLQCSTSPAAYTTTGVKDVAVTQSSVTLNPGTYYFGATGEAATLVLKSSTNSAVPIYNCAGSASSSGALPATTTICAASWQANPYGGVAVH